jgi:hypothetical protein
MSMTRHHRLLLLAAALVLLIVASPASANSIAPTFLLFHAVFSFQFMLWLALPASVLAAVLERPFVLRAGVREHTLSYSLQANFVSLVIGYATFPLCASLPMDLATRYDVLGLLWPLFTIGLSIVSEGCYYQWIALKGRGCVRWGWVIGANLFSSAVLLFLPYTASAMTDLKYSWVRAVDRYMDIQVLAEGLDDCGDVLLWAGVIGSVVVFVAGFLAPSLLRWTRSVPNPSPVCPAVADVPAVRQPC